MQPKKSRYQSKNSTRISQEYSWRKIVRFSLESSFWRHERSLRPADAGNYWEMCDCAESERICEICSLPILFPFISLQHTAVTAIEFSWFLSVNNMTKTSVSIFWNLIVLHLSTIFFFIIVLGHWWNSSLHILKCGIYF